MSTWSDQAVGPSIEPPSAVRAVGLEAALRVPSHRHRHRHATAVRHTAPGPRAACHPARHRQLPTRLRPVALVGRQNSWRRLPLHMPPTVPQLLSAPITAVGCDGTGAAWGAWPGPFHRPHACTPRSRPPQPRQLHAGKHPRLPSDLARPARPASALARASNWHRRAALVRRPHPAARQPHPRPTPRSFPHPPEKVSSTATGWSSSSEAITPWGGGCSAREAGGGLHDAQPKCPPAGVQRLRQLTHRAVQPDTSVGCLALLCCQGRNTARSYETPEAAVSAARAHPFHPFALVILTTHGAPSHRSYCCTSATW